MNEPRRVSEVFEFALRDIFNDLPESLGPVNHYAVSRRNAQKVYVLIGQI